MAGLELCNKGKPDLNLYFYEPSDEIKFQFAESLGSDDDAIVSCMEKVMNDLILLQLFMRNDDDVSQYCFNGNNDDNNNRKEQNQSLQDISSKISMSNLFHLLHHAENLDDGIIMEEVIKEVWKVHPNPTLRHKLDEGVTQLLGGKTRDALDIFTSLLQEEGGGGDATYAEAWNKKSTCHYMLGENEKSMEAALKVLEFQPQHFQAKNGIGLIQYENQEYELAVESFRGALKDDPWSPVSTRLSACLDQVEMKRLKKKEEEVEEEGAAEGSAPYERNK